MTMPELTSLGLSKQDAEGIRCAVELSRFSVGHTERGHLELYRHTQNGTWLKEYRLPMAYDVAPSACILNGKIWLAGGQRAPSCHRSVRYANDLHSLRLDFNAAGESWLVVNKEERAFCTRRICAAMAGIGGRLFLCGGVTRRGREKQDLCSVEVFDVGTGTWGVACDLPSARRSATAVAVHGNLFLIGGLGETALDEILRYAEDRNTWEVKARLRWNRHSMGCGTDGSLVYLVGGCGWNEEASRNEPVEFVECFDTATGKLRSLPPLPEKGYDCGVTVVNHAMLHVFGGSFTANEHSVDWVFRLDTRNTAAGWTRAEVGLPEPCDISLSAAHVL